MAQVWHVHTDFYKYPPALLMEAIGLIPYMLDEDEPPLHPIAQTQFKGDTVLVYPHGWVCVKRADKSYEVARLD